MGIDNETSSIQSVTSYQKDCDCRNVTASVGAIRFFDERIPGGFKQRIVFYPMPSCDACQKPWAAKTD